MKIWCCFGLGEDEEEVRGTMREGMFGNENDDESEGKELGFLLGGQMSDLEENEMVVGSGGGGGGGGGDQWQLGVGGWRQFDQFASTSGQGIGDNGEAFFPEKCDRPEGSERDDCDSDDRDSWDVHHKRAKVHSYSQQDSGMLLWYKANRPASNLMLTSRHSYLEVMMHIVLELIRGCTYAITAMPLEAGNSSSSTDRDYNVSQSPIPFNNEILRLTSMSNDSDDENPLDSNDGRDEEGDGFSTSKMEDLEVRMDLTDDLLHMVFSFLDHINLCRAAIVCKQWRAGSSHEDFWRCLNFENRNISEEQFEDMCRRYPNATEVNIFGAPSIHSLVMTAMSSLRNLETLTLGKGTLGDAFFQALADCHMLKRLLVNDATLGNGIQEIPIYHDRLHHLQITKCRVLRISVRCPQLETLSLKRSSMAHAVLNCPLLHDLDIGSCHKLTDAAIRSAATSCPLLESLDMSNCSCVSDDTLREIALTCANLHILDASYCPNISLESVRLSMLTVLKLHSCEGITSASMAAISHSYMLEVLELDNCSLLTSVSLELPRLQNIRLVHCRKFVDLNLRSIMLSSMTVSNCPALHRINVTSNSLQKLVLQKQASLTTLALQCQYLQEVDLTDCESLTNSICDVFSDDGGCPMLKSLVLDNCECLTAVGFRSTSLVSLSLVGCRAITSLELVCPYLEQVHLDGCDHLERASFRPIEMYIVSSIASTCSYALPILPRCHPAVLHMLARIPAESPALALRLVSQLSLTYKAHLATFSAPSMVQLELKGCGGLSEASINCPMLTSLDASFCSKLKDDCLSATAASCPFIESLILMSCPSVGYEGLSSLRLLPHLTLLDLSYTFLMNLQPVFESCLQLKVLKLQACKYLTDSSLEALYKEGALPALCELDLSYGALCQSAIEELLACCTHLTHVSLNGCLNMHDLNWGFSSGPISELPSIYNTSSLSSHGDDHELIEQPNRLLQNLNCVGCQNIKKVLIPPMARCTHLSSLNLSLSANLKEVDVACYNLCFLNLSNCSSLEILKLECPRLTSLFLQSCNITVEAVEAAISQCNMLETLDIRFCPKMAVA
ncbi:F-box/LRR-repeat protein 15 [Vitis vinifera]|uniref:F-box/LRR-repeat protein 15 n=1 Tax=Vitis vinifera TaxID=29760 RepID=A0A438EX12_VITVI|nr:F-box/LRR-repeat protein 15 [Vitis vinifera]